MDCQFGSVEIGTSRYTVCAQIQLNMFTDKLSVSLITLRQVYMPMVSDTSHTAKCCIILIN